MDRETFEELVEEALEHLPAEFASILENIDVCVEDRPSRAQLNELGMRPGDLLLGLYEGVPLTERGHFYGMVAPDKITVFQKTIEYKCHNDPDRIIREVKRVVRHEIAHHFGITDARLEELENGED